MLRTRTRCWLATSQRAKAASAQTSMAKRAIMRDSSQIEALASSCAFRAQLRLLVGSEPKAAVRTTPFKLKNP